MPNISTGSNWSTVWVPHVGWFHFSYQTLVAFQKEGCKQVKHLNAIDYGPKSKRLPAAAFEAAYHQAFGK